MKVDYRVFAFLKQKLPNRREAILLFIACAFFVNVWSIFNLLRVLPSFFLRLRSEQILYLASYTQSYALLESIGVWLVLALLGFLLPQRLLGDHLAAKGAFIVFMTSLWAIAFHYLFRISIYLKNTIAFISQLIGWSMTETHVQTIALFSFVILWVAVYIFGMFWGLSRISRQEKFKERIYNLLGRLEVLTWLYLSLDVLGLMVVIYRNI